MAVKIFSCGKITFKIWEHSLRMVFPAQGPVLRVYDCLDSEEKIQKAVEDYYSMMNFGIDLYLSNKKKLENRIEIFRVG